MNVIDRVMGYFAPGAALARARSRAALGHLARYDAATSGNRGKSWKPVASDADTAGAQRTRLAFIARDMVRNTPLATRAQQVISNNVVGDGITPKVVSGSAEAARALLSVIEQHADTVAIDADGRCNLYGLQRMVINTVVEAGEVLVRRRRRLPSDGFALPFQLQVMEPDFLDGSRDGFLPGGNEIRGGIEFDAIGRRVAYYILQDHPGGSYRRGLRSESSRVPASEILHIFRQDRPGQSRGVSWFAPIALSLQDLADFQDAQLMRQKIAACFAAFRVAPDGDGTGDDPAGLSESIIPGRIQNLAPGEDIRFADPPGVNGYDEFTRSVLRSVAAGLGITYEALSGDLSNVNFSSARMGRMEMDRCMSAVQWLMMIPQFLQPVGQWIIEDWRLINRTRETVRIDWTPPHRVMIDPTREIAALTSKVRSGFASRSSVIQELGYDPQRVMEDITRDAANADALNLVFDSDARTVSAAGVAQAVDQGEQK